MEAPAAWLSPVPAAVPVIPPPTCLDPSCLHTQHVGRSKSGPEAEPVSELLADRKSVV